jgi:hypothetical protein
METMEVRGFGMLRAYLAKVLNIRVFETMLYHGIFYFNRTFACLEIKYCKS